MTKNVVTRCIFRVHSAPPDPLAELGKGRERNEKESREACEGPEDCPIQDKFPAMSMRPCYILFTPTHLLLYQYCIFVCCYSVLTIST